MRWLLICILFLVLPKFLTAQKLDWLKSFGDKDTYSIPIATDINGHVYVAGSYASPTVVFGSYTLTSAGSQDIFILKLNDIGDVLWAKSIGGIGGEVAYSITTDLEGNLVMWGYFTSPTITIGNQVLINNGGRNLLIVKYSTEGVLIFAKSYGGGGNEDPTSISTDLNNNIYVAGVYYSTVDFDGLILQNSSIYYSYTFLVKYDPNGNVLWAKSISGDRGAAIHNVLNICG